jgi:hypothetical protein
LKLPNCNLLECLYFMKDQNQLLASPKNSGLPAFFLASSCGKWCHHLSLGCGYLTTILNELWT